MAPFFAGDPAPGQPTSRPPHRATHCQGDVPQALRRGSRAAPGTPPHPRLPRGPSLQPQVHAAADFSPLLQVAQYWRYLADAYKDMAHEGFQELLHSLGPPPQPLQRLQSHPPQPQVHGAALFSPLLQQAQNWYNLADASKNMAHGEFQELLHSIGPPPQSLQHQDSPTSSMHPPGRQAQLQQPR